MHQFNVNLNSVIYSPDEKSANKQFTRRLLHRKLTPRIVYRCPLPLLWLFFLNFPLAHRILDKYMYIHSNNSVWLANTHFVSHKMHSLQIPFFYSFLSSIFFISIFRIELFYVFDTCNHVYIFRESEVNVKKGKVEIKFHKMIRIFVLNGVDCSMFLLSSLR